MSEQILSGLPILKGGQHEYVRSELLKRAIHKINTPEIVEFKEIRLWKGKAKVLDLSQDSSFLSLSLPAQTLGEESNFAKHLQTLFLFPSSPFGKR